MTSCSQESFREKYNLAQYASVPLASHNHKPPMIGSGSTNQIAKNLPAPSLPHNLAARTKLMAYNKRGTSVAGHYDRLGSGSQDDVARPGEKSVTARTTYTTNQPKFVFDSR